MEDLYAFMDVQLTFPFNRSVQIVEEFAHTWSCKIIHLSSIKGYVILALHSEKFKIIFGSKPRISKYSPPENTEHFIEGLSVFAVKPL